MLALGNITGAMVFQATFPVTIGLLFTPWRLDQPAGVAAAIALVAAGVLFLTASLKGRASRPASFAAGDLVPGARGLRV